MKVPRLGNRQIMSQDLSQILSRAQSGDPKASELLLPMVYEELRKLAASRLAHEPPGQTLQATALVHEAYLKLTSDNPKVHWEHRGHFFAAAAEAMRRILIDQARRKRRIKHGGDLQRVHWDLVEFEAVSPQEDIEALDLALEKLKQVDATAAELVHLRYFTGLPLADAAEIMNISTRTANRVWAFARAWLYREMQQSVEQ
jgi:RNA polymerase sigma factor (TIGR02999 family)